jgi:hypothetical protein
MQNSADPLLKLLMKLNESSPSGDVVLIAGLVRDESEGLTLGTAQNGSKQRLLICRGQSLWPLKRSLESRMLLLRLGNPAQQGPMHTRFLTFDA